MQLEFAVADVKAKVQANRDQHEATYREALDNFKQELVAITVNLRAAAEQYRDGDTDWASYEREAREALSLRRPRHFLDHYDAALSMLELTTAQNITLDTEDYARYILDDWEWKDTFVGTTSNYLGGKFSR
jgi:hypothetical protein